MNFIFKHENIHEIKISTTIKPTTEWLNEIFVLMPMVNGSYDYEVISTLVDDARERITIYGSDDFAELLLIWEDVLNHHANILKTLAELDKKNCGFNILSFVDSHKDKTSYNKALLWNESEKNKVKQQLEILHILYAERSKLSLDLNGVIRVMQTQIQELRKTSHEGCMPRP